MPEEHCQINIAGFHNVDAGDSASFIAYLDAVAKAAADEKRRGYQTIGLASGMSVLDVGCGTGDDVRAIAEIVGNSGRVCGIDSSTAMIEEAIRRGTPANAQFLTAPADALPFEDSSFDAVRAERVFLHLRDPESAARELRRVTRANGRAYVFDPDWDTALVTGVDRAMTQRIVGALIARLANPFAGGNAAGLLRAAGFVSVVATPVLSRPSLAAAFDQFISSAVDYAVEAGTVTTADVAAWLHALLLAEQRGEFLCAVTGVATLATA